MIKLRNTVYPSDLSASFSFNQRYMLSGEIKIKLIGDAHDTSSVRLSISEMNQSEIVSLADEVRNAILDQWAGCGESSSIKVCKSK